jgi:hypothetical protein
LAVALLMVAGWSGWASGGFTGSWTSEIGLSPIQTMPFTAFSSTLEVGFAVDFFEVSTTSDFIMTGWLWQELGLAAELGFFGFDGTLLFDPQSASFLYGTAAITLNFGPIRTTLHGAMVGPTHPGGLNWGYVLDIYGEMLNGSLWFESATFLGADLSGITFAQTNSSIASSLLTKYYPVDPTIGPPCAGFSGQQVLVGASLFDCIDFLGVTTFDCTGFVSQVFELSYMNLFGSPLGITLSYEFTLQTASHTFTPSLTSDFGCLKVFADLLGSGGTITGVEIYGIQFEITLGGATFSSLSNLNTTDYVLTYPGYEPAIKPLADAIADGDLYYPQDYWEIISLVVNVPPSGCGFSFYLDTFFSNTSTMLFDWAESDMGISVSMGSLLTLSTGVTVGDAGFMEWRVGISASW